MLHSMSCTTVQSVERLHHWYSAAWLQRIVSILFKCSSTGAGLEVVNELGVAMSTKHVALSTYTWLLNSIFVSFNVQPWQAGTGTLPYLWTLTIFSVAKY